ncbi:MAG: EF-P beta-lysylation protein EpmB [Methylococcaceae bacterium]|jgi:EF-P beta-lysylation protein EpmB
MATAPFKTEPSPQNWQQQLADAFTNLNDLCRYLELPPEAVALSATAAENFPLRVPRSYAENIKKATPNDPLLLQILPLQAELWSYPGFSDDPVGDLNAIKVPGVLHKYHGRALFINTGSCAINCRYCFRRNFPYADFQLSKEKEQAAIAYIEQNPSISEVILSGGDPLTLSDNRLAKLILQLNQIKHLKRLRIHSRLPTVLPARITTDLIDIFNKSCFPIVMVIHCNHANELNHQVIAALTLLKNSRITLLNQSVLLKNINDSSDALCALSEALFDYGVMPYYLHILDKAQGTGHFEVSEAIGLNLIKQMQAVLPGYLVPKLVKEIAGAPAKQAVNI